MNFSKKEWLLFGLIVLSFFVLRLPGVYTPYHQDEYKWAYIVDQNSPFYDPERIPHPPLGTAFYETGSELFGFSGLRIVPLIFTFANLFLLFYLVKTIFDKRTAFWATGLFVVGFFSVLASLMVDTDGAIMPFFALLSFIFYFKYIQSKQNYFLLLLFGSLVLGFLIKVSFALVPAALALDFAIHQGAFSDKKRLLKYLLGICGLAVVFAALLYVAKFFFPFFNLESSAEYWEHFVNFHRNWFQIVIQVVKVVLYLSPFLLLPILFIDKEIFKQTRVFFIFICLGLLFYLVAFDFSIGALDRYLQFLVIPLSIISAAVFAKHVSLDFKKSFLWSGILALIVFALQFLPHLVFPLYPKTEWLNRAFSFKWNFLYPLNGGSGPLPFYVSFLFIGAVWVISLALVAYAFKNRSFINKSLVGVLVLGLFYNIVFTEEYEWGKINGSTKDLLRETVAFVKNNPDIKKVTVYNDNGGSEIVGMDKYRKRLYVDPKFDIKEKVQSLNQYKEYYMVIDIPHLDPNTVYAKYFSSCKIIFEKQSGQISSFVYDCRKAPDIKL